MATTITTENWLPFLLQTSDAVFPTGAYAHSLGLEQMVQQGRVTDEATLLGFLHRHILPALSRLDLPLVREARAARDLEDLLAVDRLAGALKAPRELREASLQTGRRRLAMLVRLYPDPLLEALHAATLERPTVGHHAIVWGAACARMPEEAALTAYFYQSVSAFCTAAPKLIRLGQEGAQRVLAAALARSEDCVAAAQAVAREDIGWFDPLLDIASMQHEIAGERLFIS